MRVVVMRSVGGPEVIETVTLSERRPGAGEVEVAVAAAGVNFMDTGVRRGQSWADMPLPRPLGVEGAGRVLSVGDGVTDFAPGDRVAWVYVPGSYADRIIAPADALVSVPDGIDDRTAAAIMMQGLTASHFATDFIQTQRGDVALVHAAAGGLGQLLTQIIKLHGGTVIGRVSSEAKVDAARRAGAEHVIVSTDGNFADQVLALTGGLGVAAVYDGSGPSTFEGSLASLRRSGTFCWYGPVLGPPQPIKIMSLPRSIKLGYAVFFDHIPTPALLRERSARLFDWIAAGDLRVEIGVSYALGDAAQAHRDIESRQTTGKLLLIP
ncbi:quinone oxidoreductase family protein [Sphingobium yanoikuyae]|uniref:Alcohol dehydrogenase n=1 Tax=Sphingobium yanoikuyae TaxID=13690 RepID=A0A291N793_SPHYA|nr:quinone oxidoreductase [Sphingobium yanoikuyae]ATI83274.1 alcohol dehydrogenase [Sphingobium yanoikuyae]